VTQDEARDLIAQYGSIRKAAAATGVPRETLRARAVGKYSEHGGRTTAAAAIGKGELRGDVKPAAELTAPLPTAGVKRYIVTCAQNNTKLHDGLWDNLTALAAHYSADILVSRFTYDTAAYGEGTVKPGTAKTREDVWYDPRIAGAVCGERTELAPGLVFCAELNILPTAVRPLSGLETYTGRRSAIIPHVKLAMDSIASGKFEPTKFVYTTGAVTLRNYIQKKAGQKAEFHHCYGALLVEVNAAGEWWVRQLNADSEGVIYDLTLKVDGGMVTDGHRVEAVNWGDIHVARLEDVQAQVQWGRDGIAETLVPRYQFMHDTLDFKSRNHHEAKDPHARFARFVEGAEEVSAELRAVANFLATKSLPDCETVVVDSNHDNALTRWLRDADFKTDHVNAVFYLEAQLAKYKAIAHGDRDFHVLEWAVQRHLGPVGARFLREDESFIICKDRNGGIECGMHGHLGPNGARGSAAAFAKMGRKANVGHTHSAGIHDGIYTAGVSGSLDLEYNKGPSSWSHSHIVTYANGKRAIITVWNGKWRA
jgi:hypothetical protein